MRNYTKCFLATTLFGAMLPSYGQDSQKEAIAKDMEAFVVGNMNKYDLTPEKVARVKQILIEEGKEHGAEMPAAKVQEILTDMKKVELRELYFETNVQNQKSLSSEYENVHVCDNGNFDIRPGFATYEFSYAALDGVDFNCGLDENLLAPYYPSGIVNSFSDHVTIVDNDPLVSGGFDPTLHALSIDVPRVSTANYAIKLNNDTFGFGVTSMSKKFRISGDIVSYNFSIVFENPTTHRGDEQPYFIAKLLDSNGRILDINCIKADVYDTAMFNIAPTFDPSSPLLYTGWQCDFLKISPYDLEHMPDDEILELVFIMTDCGQGQHFGTVYIDDICNIDSCEPMYGDVNLNIDPQIYCPEFPLEICGTFGPPHQIDSNPLIYGTLTGATLEIMDGWNVVNTITSYTQTGNDFCFVLQASDLGTPPAAINGLRTTVTFDVNGISHSISNPPHGVAPHQIINLINCEQMAVEITERKNPERQIELVKISEAFEEVTIYPNPTNNELNIQVGNMAVRALTITTLDGKTIKVNQQSDNGNYRLDMSSVSQGVYILTIEKNNGDVMTQKIIKH